MSEEYDYGPLQSWEIIWRSGHIETVQGHQAALESAGASFRSALLGSFSSGPSLPPRLIIHGQVGGHWRLVLAVDEADIVSVRNVTARDSAPAGDPQ